MSLVFCSEEATGRGRNSIYLGGKVDAKDLPSLRAKSITHILNVTPPKEAGVQVGLPCSLGVTSYCSFDLTLVISFFSFSS